MQHLDDGTLQAWLDGTRSGLSAAERIDIARHLASCASCAAKLEELDALSLRAEVLLSTSDSMDEPIPAFEAVLARAEKSQATARRRSPWRAAAWAASIAIALGVGWMANGLHRGADVARMAASEAKTDSVTETQVAAAAEVAPDTSSPGTEPPTLASSAEQTRMADATPVQDKDSAAGAPTSSEPPPAEPVVAALRTRPDSGRLADEARAARGVPEAPQVAAAKPLASGVTSVRPAPAAEALRKVAMAADLQSAPDSGPALVRGKVTDESGRPLSAAQVVVKGTGVGALTQQDGTFELALEKLPADSASRQVTLTAQLIGFRQASRELAVQGGTVASLDFRLAPRSVALNEIAVTGAAAEARRQRSGLPEIVVPAGDPTWGGWRAMSRDEAETAAGFLILTVPDLPVVRIELGSAEGAMMVRVIQELDGGGRLELVEARQAVRFDQSAVFAGRAYATVRRGDVSVAAAAPVAGEVLEALLVRLSRTP
ncbi:MAG: carboxypeptidase-like regulatory domain-containing protein [Gemmatimonadetes bacterium]|nr:carboxypeptidase-like regulatory domain-containing protein [Gemmatimonadota bacterium]